MQAILVIDYSHTGMSHVLSHALAERQGWAAGGISEAKPGRNDMRCALDTLLRRTPAIRYDGPPPSQFDAVVLVAPIWIARLAGPMRSFVHAWKAQLPDVAVIAVKGSSAIDHAAAEVAHILGRPTVLDEGFRAQEILDGSFTARLDSFAAMLQAMPRRAPALAPVSQPLAA